MNAQLLSHGIQLAVAPVFLLTAIAAMLGVVSGRLARIIDRARAVESLLDEDNPRDRDNLEAELDELYQRSYLINRAITLSTSCGLFVCLVIALLFMGDATGVALLEKLNLRADGISTFFADLMGKESTDMATAAGIWSSHPPTKERIDATRRPATGRPPFSDAEWRALRQVCGSTPGEGATRSRRSAPSGDSSREAPRQ